MNRSARALAVVGLLVAAPLGSSAALAQYDYGTGGGGGGGATGESGFLILLEAIATNPRNVDNVVATDHATGVTPVIPNWDDDVAGRIGLGWGFASGNRIMATLWRYQTEQTSTGSGSFYFPIGPPIPDGSDFRGDEGGFFANTSEITAQTADLAWGRLHNLGAKFTLDWTVGLRYADYEEVHSALYDEALSLTNQKSYAAAKSNQGQMIGARIGIGGRYRFARNWSFAGGFAYSGLDGEITAASQIVATGSQNSSLGSNSSTVVDDGRSGTITDLEVEIAWHLASDSVRLSLGWEQSIWNDIAADLVRNFPGTVAPLKDRESVTFSGYSFGVRLRF